MSQTAPRTFIAQRGTSEPGTFCSRRCHDTLKEDEALTAVEPDRQRVKLPELKSLKETRRGG